MPVTNPTLSGGLSNIGNTAGDTANLAYQRLILAGGNGITLSGSSSGGSMTVTVSGGAGGAGFSGGVSNLGNTAGSTGVTGTRLVLVGSQNVSLSQSTDANGGTISFSAAGGGAGQFSAGASNLGNTAGATGITGTQLVMVGSGVMSLSQTTGANGGTVSILAPATSSLSATGQVSLSTNGSTISIGVPAKVTRSIFMPYFGAHMGTQTIQNATFIFNPMPQVPDLAFDRVLLPVVRSNATNSTGSGTVSFWVGLYTRNASSLSLSESTSTTHAYTFHGTVSSYSLHGSLKQVSIPWTKTLTEGDYWVGLNIRTTSGGANHSWSWWGVSQPTTSHQGLFNQSTQASMQFRLGLGQYSTSSTAVPGSVAFSQITGSALDGMRPVPVWFVSGSA